MATPGISAGLTNRESFSFEELGLPVPSLELRAGLLEAESWRNTLETYANTVKLGVGLTDVDGRLIGDCHNPQSSWQLARQGVRSAEGECSFCLTSIEPCRAVADAIRLRAPVITEDGAGLAHVAVPLILGGQVFGALIAGQVFTRYPEPLGLQRVARQFGISPQKLWNQAIRERPVSRATLLIYGTLLTTIGTAFLGKRFASLLQGKLVEANEQIERSLQEKDTLLGEIQHRVKNNLQIVASLLSLQSASLDETKDIRIIEALQASQQRVAAMAQIHTLLYTNERIGEIDLGTYLKSLAEMAIASFQSSAGGVYARYSLAPALLTMRQAIPCGLIVNELVTNAFKYAYPNKIGQIDITVNPTVKDRISFTISDHGRGMPEGVDWRKSTSLGLRIVRILTQQLDGTLELDGSAGVSFTLHFQREAI